MQLKQVLGKIKDITFGVIAAPLIIIIMMWASILDQRAFKKRIRPKKGTGKNLMAIARLSVKVGKAGKAAPHSEYIDRDEEKKLKQEQAETDLEHSAYGNMPKWAEHNPIAFWEAADLYERKNGSTYREYEIALPREMNAEQRLELVEDFIQSEIGSKYPYQFAIHNLKQWTAMISPTFTSCLMNVCKMESNEIRSSISNAITAKILNVAELKKTIPVRVTRKKNRY